MNVSTMFSLLGQGFLTTLAIFLLTLLGSLPLGLLVMAGRRSRNMLLRGVVKAYISIMRGTPLMLQLMVVFYGPKLLLGIVAGSRQGTIVDFLATMFALLGQSMSTVWMGILVIYIFAVKLKWFPAMGYGTWKTFILPAMTLGYPVAAQVTRMGRSGIIDVLKEDYITATYAKGISRAVVYTKYAFKNALIPIVTIVGMQIGIYLAGAVVVETIFAWPGFGQLIFQAVGTRDYPLVQSCLLVSAALFAIVNMLVDIVNSFIDPRITLQ